MCLFIPIYLLHIFMKEINVITLYPCLSSMIEMKNLFYITFIGLMMSCGSTNKIGIVESDIEKVEVIQADRTIDMKDGFEGQLIQDLNNSKYLGPTKYIKTHWILLHLSNGTVDSILTNGTVHQYNGWYETEENLIEKYSK
jgi:hypothetical protein